MPDWTRSVQRRQLRTSATHGAELVAIYTGLRVSELAGLRWNDVHENGITIDERFAVEIGALPKVMHQIQPLPYTAALLNAFTD
jgi:integrase